jgi:hypothetical protein
MATLYNASIIATSLRASLPRDDGEGDTARVFLAVMDGLVGDDALLPPRRSDHATRIRIAIEPREVAGRNLDPDPVARLEDIACRPEIDLERIHLTRRH